MPQIWEVSICGLKWGEVKKSSLLGRPTICHCDANDLAKVLQELRFANVLRAGHYITLNISPPLSDRANIFKNALESCDFVLCFCPHICFAAEHSVIDGKLPKRPEGLHEKPSSQQ